MTVNIHFFWPNTYNLIKNDILFTLGAVPSSEADRARADIRPYHVVANASVLTWV
jgi:hypothetical protein